jgi:hypothetical protein
MAPSPSPRDIDRAAKRLRADLEEHGLLLAHDSLLPSARALLLETVLLVPLGNLA